MKQIIIFKTNFEKENFNLSVKNNIRSNYIILLLNSPLFKMRFDCMLSHLKIIFILKKTYNGSRKIIILKKKYNFNLV